MTQEEKSILIQDICSRFPYGVVIDVDATDWNVPQGHIKLKIEGFGIVFKDMSLIVNGSYYGDKYKPYLRPISSMTEEEWEEYDNFCDDCRGAEYFELIDWLNAHHFDYRNLIERGLAIAVTEENNPYKE